MCVKDFENNSNIFHWNKTADVSPNPVQITECSESDTAVMSAWWSPDLADKTLWLFSIQFIPGYYQADIDRETLLTGSDEIFLILKWNIFSSSGRPRRGSAKRRQTTARTSWTTRIRWEVTSLSWKYFSFIELKIFLKIENSSVIYRMIGRKIPMFFSILFHLWSTPKIFMIFLSLSWKYF